MLLRDWLVAWFACHTSSTPMRHLYNMYFTNQAFYASVWASCYMVCPTTASFTHVCASWLLGDDGLFTILKLMMGKLDLLLTDCGMWCCVWQDQTRYLANIEVSSHPEQVITTTPTASTTSPQEALETPKESTDPCPSTYISPPPPTALKASYPLLDLIYTIFHNLMHHLLPSMYACYLPPSSHASHFETLPLPALAVCAPYSPYPPPPSHQASLSWPSSPQRYSYSGVYPHDAPSPL